MSSSPKPLESWSTRESHIGEFLSFLCAAKIELKKNLASANDPRVKEMRSPVEENYVDDQGKDSMYQRIESAFYDDAQELVTLWRFFENYRREQLVAFHRLLQLEQEGLAGDRHPRKVFDRSPFGIVALIIGTVTIWMTMLKTFTGEDNSELLEFVRFNWVTGAIWIVGLFIVLWFILKTVRNNRQLAVLASIRRAFSLYLP